MDPTLDETTITSLAHQRKFSLGEINKHLRDYGTVLILEVDLKSGELTGAYISRIRIRG